MVKKSIFYHLSSATRIKHLTDEEIDPLVACLDQPYNLDPPSLVPLFTRDRQRIKEQIRVPKIPNHIAMTEEAERKRFVGSMRDVLKTVEYWETRRTQFPIENVIAGETQLNPFQFTSIRMIGGQEVECPSHIHLIRLCKTRATYAPSVLVKPLRDISTRIQTNLYTPLSPEILGRVAKEELGEIIDYCDSMGFKWWLMAVQKTKIPIRICDKVLYNVTERRPLMFMPGGAFPLPVNMEADEEGRPAYTTEIIANFTAKYTRRSPPILS